MIAMKKPQVKKASARCMNWRLEKASCSIGRTAGAASASAVFAPMARSFFPNHTDTSTMRPATPARMIMLRVNMPWFSMACRAGARIAPPKPPPPLIMPDAVAAYLFPNAGAAAPITTPNASAPAARPTSRPNEMSSIRTLRLAGISNRPAPIRMPPRPNTKELDFFSARMPKNGWDSPYSSWAMAMAKLMRSEARPVRD